MSSVSRKIHELVGRWIWGCRRAGVPITSLYSVLIPDS